MFLSPKKKINLRKWYSSTKEIVQSYWKKCIPGTWQIALKGPFRNCSYINMSTDYCRIFSIGQCSNSIHPPQKNIFRNTGSKGHVIPPSMARVCMLACPDHVRTIWDNISNILFGAPGYMHFSLIIPHLNPQRSLIKSL